MSDLLTHWAVFEDCRRLAALDERIEPLFVELIEEGQEYGRLGAITRSGNRIMPTLLTSARERYATDTARARKTIAFVLGCLTHQACDHVMKPLLSEVAQSDWDTAHHTAQRGAHDAYGLHNEISAYYDTHVFKVVYASGEEEPFSSHLLADLSKGPTSHAEAFVRSLFQRALLSAHTFVPDVDDPDRWLDRILDLYQELYVNVNLYVRVWQHPEPAKLAAYGVTDRFYNETDPAILVARTISSAPSTSAPADFDRYSLDVQHNHSAYAKALCVGLRYLRNASALWHGETNELVSPG